MFKKLKDKITEEVKISPQRFQQLTQSVSDKLQGTSANQENMFSIGEDDEHSSNVSPDQGFSSVNLVSPSSDNRSRRLSNSSMASDVSFLPRYEASGNLYHLQSDLDVSASELEDNLSQASSQQGQVTKEQIYAAYQKSQMRYHKYRGRYTDLARHYTELERENAKMKSVLVETQDKAIRRVTELKEQCSLEQKAKAHLESALRNDLEEKQMKIESLNTKIELLQRHNSSADLVELNDKEVARNADSADKLAQLTKYLNEARNEIEALNNKIQEFKASSIVFQSKEQENKARILALEREIASFSEREKENNIKLAENKMELHNELIGKDSEISRLKEELESLKNHKENQGKSTKMDNLQSQNSNLIEKLEKLTQKCNGLENELLKVEKYKMDIKELTDLNLELNKNVEEGNNILKENSELKNVISSLKNGLSACQDNLNSITKEKENLIETIQKEKTNYECQIENLRESAKKGLFTLEKQIIDKLRLEYEDKEAALKDDFKHKLNEISANSQAIGEVHMQLIEKDNIIQQISEKLQQRDLQYRELESNHLQLIEESSQLRVAISRLEQTLLETNKQEDKVYEDKIGRLQANIATLQEEVLHLEKMCKDKEIRNIQLAKDNSQLETANAELHQNCRLMEERQEASELEITENNLLEVKIQALEEEKNSLLNSFELERKLFNKILEEHNELKTQEVLMGELENRNKKLEEKVVRLKGFLTDKEQVVVELNKEKVAVEQELNKAKELIRIKEERNEAIDLDRTECGLLQIKVQQLEAEKDNLLKSFERERECYDQTFHKKNEELLTHKEDIIKENVDLAKENLELKSVNEELFRKVRISEEREQVVELERSECDLLKLKLQKLEEEKEELLKSFEMERELFNKTLIEHKELKLKEEQIKDLEGSNVHLTEKIVKLKEHLKQKEETIVKLHKDNLSNEQKLAKLNESLKIRQEHIDSLQIEKTECGLLEMKVRALEEEKQNLLKSFEMERTTFEESLSKGASIENQIDQLNQKIIVLKEEKENLENAFSIEKRDLMDSFEDERRSFQLTDSELIKVKEENILLKEEKDRLNFRLKEKSESFNTQVTTLAAEVNSLQEVNKDISKELDDRQEKLVHLTDQVMQLNNELQRGEEKYKNILDTLKKEKSEKKAAIERVKEMQLELDRNNVEISEIKKSLESVDKLYKEAKSRQSGDDEILIETKRKLAALENEKISLEKELKKKVDEFQYKTKEMSIIEQQFTNLTQDKEALMQENKQMKDRIEEFSLKFKELDQVRKQNEVLQKECDKLNQEISELKVRINQLSSDNRIVNEEHEKLLAEMEGFKAKCEFLENEKGELDQSRLEIERERDSLRVAVTDLSMKLEENRIPDANSDLMQNFLDLKSKCEALQVENKNLKTEYSKMEEQFTNFPKEKKEFENQIVELERYYSEVLHEKQLLQDEIEELKISPINSTKLENMLSTKQLNGPNSVEKERLQQENENLKDRLHQYKSLDITNKSSIEFYEGELQKMKIKNEKLNRKLDETLVTLNHCTELSSSTEIEYLKNVLYNYMLGKESLVLARVIAAVCKFDPSQTEAVLQKEQQKQTLLGQLGII